MKLEKFEYVNQYVVKMTFSATPEELQVGVDAVQERKKGQTTRPNDVYWEAVNDIMDRDVDALIDQAAAENNLKIVGKPSYNMISLQQDGKGFVTEGLYALDSGLTLTKYTGLEAVCKPAPVTDKEVDAEIDRVRRAHPDLVPHKGPAVKGNIAVLDYEGTIDGEPFQGGSAKEQKLVLGSGRMIPGFEEGILGHAGGEEFDIDVTFPANYRAKELAGKAAVFHIVLHSVNVNQLPALDSEFAKKVGNVDTMDEYRAAVRARLEANRRDTALNAARSDLMLQVGQNMEGELPTLMIDQEFEAQMENLEYQLQGQRMTKQRLLQQIGQTEEAFDARVRENAERQVRVRLALNLVAEQEGLLPTDAELEAEIETRAANLKRTVEQYKKLNDPDALRRRLTRQRAQDFVLSHCTIRDADGNPVEAVEKKA